MVVTGHTKERVSPPVSSGKIQIDQIWRGPAKLGECPLWDARRERLFWIDSLGQKIWSAAADGREIQSWEIPDLIGSIGLCDDDRLIAGLGGGFGLVSLNANSASVDWIGDPDPDQADTRLNDGKVDRHGRFWCGTMNINFADDNAALFRLDCDRYWERVDDGFTVSNGLAFSPDGRKMYFSDSRVDRSYQYDLDPDTGNILKRRPFLETTTYDGRVDGATVDADGNYWAALFEGSAIACFSQAGRMLKKIELPFSCPTMCAFGGPNLDILFVTSATFSQSEAELGQQRLSGGLLAIQGLEARGLEEPRYKPN